MKPKALAVLGAILIAVAAGIALLRQREPEPAPVIYLLDARRNSSTPLEETLPVIKRLERKYGAKVIVRAADSLEQLRGDRAMFEEHDRTRHAIPPLPMFVALVRPYTITKKKLRSAVEERASLQGADRARLLRRLVVVRETDKLEEIDECRQLDDDVLYAKDNFFGIGLLVHEGTLQGLKKCIDLLTPGT